MKHIQFETSELTLSPGGTSWKGTAIDYGADLACDRGLRKYYRLPAKPGSRIVIVFTTRRTAVCPSVYGFRMNYAGYRAAVRAGVYDRIWYRKLWWWVELVT